jgi:thiosulfate dehydrogenase (quinone) large subunit
MKVASLPLLLLRFFVAWTFLWAFFDKLLGLSYATAQENAWLAGGSPTRGFLSFGTEGKMFQNFFQSLAGNPLVDILFMFGLLLIGAALLLGIGMRIAGYSVALLTLLMWLAVFPPTNNPFTDEHLLYAIAGLVLSSSQAGNLMGFGKVWSKKELVKKYPIFR